MKNRRNRSKIEKAWADDNHNGFSTAPREDYAKALAKALPGFNGKQKCAFTSCINQYLSVNTPVMPAPGQQSGSAGFVWFGGIR